MQTIQAWLKTNGLIKHSDNQPYSSNDLRLLVEHLLQKDRAWLYSHPEYLFSTDQALQLDLWLDALKNGQPLAYITGEKMFWDLNLKVNSHTLIPRPDTEIIIETVLELFAEVPPNRILDLGTGSGALALVLAKIFSKSKVVAVDKSDDALEVAKHNAKSHRINNIQFKQSDWFAALKQPCQFDLIVSNPPYIAADDSHLCALRHEPIQALVADQDGLGDFQRIINQAKNYLKKDGIVMFEHGWQQKQPLQVKLYQAGFNKIDTRKDLAGHDRVTFAYND